MDKVVEFLKKIENGEDQVIIGLNRAYGNLKVAKAILEAARAQDLGPSSNEVLDELIVLVDKAEQIVGSR